MSRDRTRITVDGNVIEMLKDGITTVIDHNTELEALEAAKVLIDEEISEVGS